MSKYGNFVIVKISTLLSIIENVTVIEEWGESTESISGGFFEMSPLVIFLYGISFK